MGAVRIFPVMDLSACKACLRPYPGHPKGCPNYGKRDTCPPKALLLDDTYDLHEGVVCVYNRFDLRAHVEKMRTNNPTWTERQLYCCLYWQGTARKQLRAQMNQYLSGNSRGLVPVYVPEACGVDVTATVLQAGIELEWPPRNFAYQIAFLCLPKAEAQKCIWEGGSDVISCE